MKRLLQTLTGAAVIAGPVGFGLLTASTVSAQTQPQPRPGTEESLRRYIDSLEMGEPNYDEMSRQMADVVRKELPEIKEIIHRMGAFRCMVFQGLGDDGMDVYQVTFEHGRIEWRISPLSYDGKVLRRGFRELP